MARNCFSKAASKLLKRSAVVFLLVFVGFSSIWSFAQAQSLFSPDLAIVDVSLSPPHPTPGSTVEVTVRIINQSATPIDEGENFFVELSPGKTQRSDILILRSGIGAFTSQEIKLQWVVTSAGEHLFRINVDANNNISESDESNNSFQNLFNATFEEFTGADLVIEQFEIIPANPIAGQFVTLQAIVTNIGTGKSGLTQVDFQSDGAEIARIEIIGLEAGSSTIVTANWIADDANRILRVKVDPLGEIPELEEENNASSLAINLHPGLNRCGQNVWIDLRAEGIPILSELTGLIEEEIFNAFLPQVKRIMEEQFEGINVGFTLSRPIGNRAQIVFNADSRGNILGQAPLGARYGVGFVYLGSFLNNASLTALPRTAQAIVLATVASHELGHLFGLPHTSAGQGSDIMAANADLSPAIPNSVLQFSSESLTRLKSLLPINCL
jgi:hypothetical protein